MNEEWKTIPFNTNYEVSNLGRIKNKKTSHVLKEKDNGHGYKIVSLYNHAIRKVWYIHRVVAITFIPNPLNKPEVNHIDGNKGNNKISNLEWCTTSENGKHAYKIGLKKITKKMIDNSRKQIMLINDNPEKRMEALQKAALVNSQKSTAEYTLNSSNQFKPLKCIELNRLFLSARRVENKLNIKRNTIHKAMEKGYETCGGYHWCYITRHRFNNYGKNYFNLQSNE